MIENVTLRVGSNRPTLRSGDGSVSLRPVVNPTPNIRVNSSPVQLRTSGQGIQGPPGPAGPGSDTHSGEAAADVVPGNAAYVQSDAKINLAQADVMPRARLFGLIITAALTGFSTDLVTQGIVTLSTAEWDAVTGQTGGLTTGSSYWLDPDTAGLITTPADPTAAFCTFVGKALNSTQIDLDPRTPIKRG